MPSLQTVVGSLPLVVALGIPGLIALWVEGRFASCAELSYAEKRTRYGVYFLIFMTIVSLIFGVSVWPAGALSLQAVAAILPHLFVGMIVTAVVAGLAGLIRQKDYFGAAMRKAGLKVTPPHASAWAKAVDRADGAIIRCELKNGSTVFGFYCTSSVASLKPGAADLYLESEWTETPNGLEKAVGTEGVWLRRDEILSVHFYSPGVLDTDAAREKLKPAEAAKAGPAQEDTGGKHSLSEESHPRAEGADRQPEEPRQVNGQLLSGGV